MSGPSPAAPGSGGPPAAEPRRELPQVPVARRVGAWLAWWVVLMSFWVILDDSIARAELLARAVVAAMGAFLAELAGYQAATRLRPRAEWLAPALRLPGQVARDTGIVFAALWRQLVHGQPPRSVFRELPVVFGDQSLEGKTRRALLVGGRSVAPNSFALGIDAERDVMVVHQLVPQDGTGE